MTLRLEAVDPGLCNILRNLLADETLAPFYLAGGTSLALRFAHRRSVDIDLFTHEAFDVMAIANRLERRHALEQVELSTNTVRGLVGIIKVDLIAHRYPVLSPVEDVDGIRLASLPDVVAMKLNAITNRGSKKDFWDYALLLEHFQHKEMLDMFSRKYAVYSRWHVEKSLLYFDDAEQEPDPVDLRGVTWPAIKTRIIAACA